MDTTASSVLGRKTIAGQQLKEARAMSVPKAFRLSMSKSADTLFDMALAVIGATQTVMGQGDLCKLFTTDKLMLLLDGPNGHPGATLFDPSIVSALVQQQTMGRVTADTDSDRPMTRTDAAMTAPLLNDVFVRVTDLLETEPDRAILRGFQFGAQVLDPRLIGLSLEENEYHVFRLTLDVAAGTKQGDVLLAFPVVAPQTTPKAYMDDSSEGSANGLHDTVMAVRTELDAVLCKLRIPLRDIQAWTTDTVLPVERATLDETTLVAQTGRKLGVGKLGQKSGFRALRLVKKTAAYSGPDRRGMQGLLVGDDTEPDSTGESIQDLSATVDLDGLADGAPDDLADVPAMDMAAFDAEPALPETGDMPDDLPELPPLEFDAENEDFPDLPPLTT